MRIQRYITAFFTFLGYCTFLFAMGAGVVVYIGYRKSMAHEAAVMASSPTQVIPMTPADTTTLLQELPEPPYVSIRPRKSASVKKSASVPAKKTTPKKSAPVSVASSAAKTTEVSAPVTYAVPEKKRTIVAKKESATAQKKAVRAKKKTAPATATATATATESMPPLLRTWQATDHSNPRSGSASTTTYDIATDNK